MGELSDTQLSLRAGKLPSALSHFEILVGKGTKRISEGTWIMASKENSLSFSLLAMHIEIRKYHRHASRLCLLDRGTPTFIQGWVEQSSGTKQQGRHILLRQQPRHKKVRIQTMPVYSLTYPIEVPVMAGIHLLA
jgi:hypothetical protein